MCMYVYAIHANVDCDMNPFPILFSYVWLRDNSLTSSGTGAVFGTPESIILPLVYSQSKNGVLAVPQNREIRGLSLHWSLEGEGRV